MVEGLQESELRDLLIKDSFIKEYEAYENNMDVEGNELDALKGAMRILNTSKPDLAISIYHRPSDLWDIILHLNSSCAGYKFAIRNYTGFPAETVLYATHMG